MNEFQFTNTLSPITNLSYHSCGNKQDGEDRLRAYFASNINKISGIGFKLDYLYGRGYYNNQATSLFNGSLYGYYLDDRYNMHAWISVNHMRMGENGVSKMTTISPTRKILHVPTVQGYPDHLVGKLEP